jgi:ATP/maltotriose-dependent transcriptional regulator MalT
MLAQALFVQGRLDEADRLCNETSSAAPPDDVLTQTIWRGVAARILAQRGLHSEAVSLAREAVQLVERTDLLCTHADAMLDLAVVLREDPNVADDESDDRARTALSLHDRKGNAAGVARARSLLINH